MKRRDQVGFSNFRQLIRKEFRERIELLTTQLNDVKSRKNKREEELFAEINRVQM